MSVSTKMIIPKTISVGYQNREDTYTQKLAYVIYTDAKGVLRKERSWQQWRDEKLGKDEYENTPRSGFVLNRKAGGYSSGWNHRNTYIRVFDPNGFEFEISVPNLLFILQETSSIQGKGLEGEFVYAWDGTELVLLPTCSEEYKKCVDFTHFQTTKVERKDIVEGGVYRLKDMKEVMYLGRVDFSEKPYRFHSGDFKPDGKTHVFAVLGELGKYDSPYITTTGYTKIAAKISDVSPHYAETFEAFKKSKYSDFGKEIKLTKTSYTGGSDWYASRGSIYIMKEDEKLFLVRVFTPRLPHNYHGSVAENMLATRFIRGAEVSLALKGGHPTFPEQPRENYSGSAGERLVSDIYTATLHTVNGFEYDLTSNMY